MLSALQIEFLAGLPLKESDSCKYLCYYFLLHNDLLQVKTASIQVCIKKHCIEELSLNQNAYPVQQLALDVFPLVIEEVRKLSNEGELEIKNELSISDLHPLKNPNLTRPLKIKGHRLFSYHGKFYNQIK